jgi:hypothetical protein
MPARPHPVSVLAVVIAAATLPAAAQLPADRLDRLSASAEQAALAFSPPSAAALDADAANLRTALRPLAALLDRSKSGADWRKYLEWPELEAQAAAGAAADPRVLRRLQDKLEATETGLDMPDFVRVRRAVTRYAEKADAARGAGGQRFGQRLRSLAAALRSAAETGSAESLAPVPVLLERLEEAGQAPGLVREIRAAGGRPNMLVEIHENLFARAVNRPVNQVQPVDEVILGTRIRGTGRTTGQVRLDFVPSPDRAAFDLIFAARNVSSTRGSQGPVTVRSSGVTDLGARRRIFLTPEAVSSSGVTASAATNSTVEGIGVNKRFGQRIIRRIASRKIAETKPQAQAIAQGRARDRVEREFATQTDPAVAQIRDQFQTRLEAPLRARGLYPEMLHLHTTDTRLVVTARKALPVQLAAASLPPPTAADHLITLRVHESVVNNVLEEKFGGRIFRQADADRLAAEMQATMPASLESDADQPPWEVTFAKHRPITVSVADSRAKVMVRGDKFVSGEREFPGMDIWATYVIGRGPQGFVLLREGDVQIYPPGFQPGSGQRLRPSETSIRRILQRRFDKVFPSDVDVPGLLPLEGELASAGPLPLAQLEARRDGWIAAGWRSRDAGVRPAGGTVSQPMRVTPVGVRSVATPGSIITR